MNITAEKYAVPYENAESHAPAFLPATVKSVMLFALFLLMRPTVKMNRT